MAVFLGLVTAFFWGTGDFLARYATLRIGTYRTLFCIQFLGIVGLVLLAWIFLRERLQWSQWCGIGVIFVGIVLVRL